jgi:hypothetical protein
MQERGPRVLTARRDGTEPKGRESCRFGLPPARDGEVKASSRAPISLEMTLGVRHRTESAIVDGVDWPNRVSRRERSNGFGVQLRAPA